MGSSRRHEYMYRRMDVLIEDLSKLNVFGTKNPGK